MTADAICLQVEELEKEMEEARAQDKELKAQAGDLASQRERASRLLSVQVRACHQ